MFFIWWACATCNGDEIILREKWTSTVFHIQNIHVWYGNVKFHRCCHGELTDAERTSKDWLQPTTDSFLAIQKIVFNDNLLKDLKHLTKFSHTGTLEVYHSLYNKWLPKSTHFSYRGMMCRSQLAALDFNSGSELDVAETKDGEPRCNVNFSKITTNWSAKPIKEPKTLDTFINLVNRVIEVSENDILLPIPDIPELPKNIAPVEKPSKEEVLSKQISRFV